MCTIYMHKASLLAALGHCWSVLQGIEGFAADQRKLEEQLAKLAADMKH